MPFVWLGLGIAADPASPRAPDPHEPEVALALGCARRVPAEGLPPDAWCRRLGRGRWTIVREVRIEDALPTDAFAEDLRASTFELTCDGDLWLRRGFEWDGATGHWYNEKLWRGSAYHDALLRMIRSRVLGRDAQPFANHRFEELVREDGYSSAAVAGLAVGLASWPARTFGPRVAFEREPCAGAR